MMLSTLPVGQGCGLLERARHRLQEVPDIVLCHVRCECWRGRLILRGWVQSYYEKQLAQEAVGRLEGVAQVVNELEVLGRVQRRSECIAMSSPEQESIPAKYQHALQCGDPQEQCRLLKEAADAGYLPAICDYGLLCQDGEEKHRWLRDAACEGYPPAMYHFALTCTDQEQRKRWLREAARKGHVEAMYQWSLECDDATEAFHWLREAANEGHHLAAEACSLREDIGPGCRGHHQTFNAGKAVTPAR